MAELFLKIVNMSISATWLVLAVLVLRFFLKKAPKWVSVLLWGIVAVRLLCPFSIESALSLIPNAETISPEIMYDQTPQITTGIHAINSVVNPILSESLAPAPSASANPLRIWIPVISVVWMIGMAVMILYTAVSYLRLRRSVRTATKLYDNLYQSAHIPSPFVLGIVNPKIYLPYPALYIDELSYDSEKFVLRTDEDVRVYEYLMKYTGTDQAISSMQGDEYTHYVLTHDNTVTWEQLWNGLISSVFGAYIDHYTICTELY